VPHESPFHRGALAEAEARDEGLSPAALSVRDALEKIAREHPGETGPELVLRLARAYCPVRLKPKERYG